MAPIEADFLQALNAGLPAGVDWKQGAVTYLRELVQDGGDEAEWFHLTKPFLGGPDFAPFWVDVFQFLDVIQKADLSQGSLVLDVGCGPGWTVQWLAKLSHHVVGIDISQELLDIAERRMRTDPYHPYPPYRNLPFSYSLRTHDIEAGPLDLASPADLALFESTLHHFENPVAALRNVRSDLAEGGLVAVIEASAPEPGSYWANENAALMARYHTIERPYTREQLYDMLELAGYECAEFYRPVNGLYPQDSDSIGSVAWELGRADNINIFFAGSRSAMERIRPDVRSIAELRSGWQPVEGCFGEESLPDGRRFRWCGPSLLVRCEGAGSHAFDVSAAGLVPGQVQQVLAIVDGEVVGLVALTGEQAEGRLEVTTAGMQLVHIQSDRVFSPGWGAADDPRVLSFMLRTSPTTGASPQV